MSRLTCLMLCVLLNSVVALRVEGAAIDEHVDAIRNRAVALNNVIIKSRVQVDYTPGAAALQAIDKANEEGTGVRMAISDGVYVTDETIRRNGPDMSQTIVAVTWPDNPKIVPPYARMEWAFVKGKLDLLTIDKVGKKRSPMKLGGLPGSVADVAIGLRDQRNNEMVDPAKDITAANVRMDADGKVELSRKDGRGVEHVWTHDPAHDYAIVRYRRVIPATGSVNYEMSMSDFKKVDGVLLPTTIVDLAFGEEDGVKVIRRTRTVIVSEYVIGDKANTPENMQIKRAE